MAILFLLILMLLPTVTIAEERECSIPDYYFYDCPQQGTIKNETYSGFYKTKFYLPYRYTDDTKYDILIMLYGANGDSDDLLTNKIRYNEKYISFCNLYDWMIYEGRMRPVIIVSMDPLSSSRNVRAAISYIANHYSTYATNGSDEALKEAREHIAIGGISKGCNKAIACIPPNADIAGTFLLFSGSTMLPLDIYEPFHTNQLASLFVCYGNEESMASMNHSYYEVLSKHAESNYEFIYDGEHEWKVWIPGMHDALSVLYMRNGDASLHSLAFFIRKTVSANLTTY